MSFLEWLLPWEQNFGYPKASMLFILIASSSKRDCLSFSTKRTFWRASYLGSWPHLHRLSSRDGETFMKGQLSKWSRTVEDQKIQPGAFSSPGSNVAWQGCECIQCALKMSKDSSWSFCSFFWQQLKHLRGFLIQFWSFISSKLISSLEIRNYLWN